MAFRIKLKYKFACAVISTFVVFATSLLVLTSMRTEACPEREPIDVVYTWVNGSDEAFQRDLSDFLRQNESRRTDVSKSRYADRHELKFSLRSLEKYAPWIRNVYIVTNGQIPYWLNLDCERLFLITHEEIFKNPDDLPTFSSPAIEMHLHRIPNISRRFLYFNDDIYLGAPVFIEDFTSPNRGYLMYFSHPLQSCAKNCPWLYVHDGHCDQECNNSECQMDGGDCKHAKKNHSLEIVDWDATLSSDAVTVMLRENHLNSSDQNDNVDFKALFSKLSDGGDVEDLVLEHNRKVLRRNRTKRRRRAKHEGASINGYMESLQRSNRLFNLHYHFVPRHVPAHIPFLIDVDVMRALQFRFEREVATTSSNRVRRGDDLQFAFTYYYFVFHERIRMTIEEIFDSFDTDESGTWSDREIRTVLSKLYRLPLNYANVDEFDLLLINCSSKAAGPRRILTTPEYERYVDSKLPTITKDTISHCPDLWHILSAKFGSRPKYKHEVVTDVNKHATFQMMTANVVDTVKKLDALRQNPTKFVCLNDNLNDNKESVDVVNALWYDFYVSIFPNPSRFELPQEYRNKFLYVGDLRDYHFRLRLYVWVCLALLVYATACTLCWRKGAHLIRNKTFR